MKSSRKVHYGAIAGATIALLTGGYIAAGGSGNSPLQTEVRPESTARPVRHNDVRNLQHLKTESELAFHGEVIDIEYVQSTSRDGQTPLPHTFVTYRVDSVIKGTPDGETVTLRFLGGWDAATSQYLSASISPQFDVGDTDILFVKGNGSSICPLVEHSAGRLRVIEGRVYTNLGREIRLAANSTLGVGPRHGFEAVRTTHVEGGEDQAIGFGPDTLHNAPSNAAFVHEVLDAIATTPAPMGRVEVEEVAFQSADATAPFLAPDFSAAPPPADAGEPVILTEEERAELASIPEPTRIERVPGPVLEQHRANVPQTEDHDG